MMILNGLLKLLVSGVALASSPGAITTLEGLPLEIGEVDYVVDESQKLSFETIKNLDASKWSQSSDKTFEIPRGSVWFRFTINSELRLPGIIEHRWNIPIDGATLYHHQGAEWIPIKPIRGFAPMFPVELSSGRHDFYLHLQNCRSYTMKTRLLISSAFRTGEDQYTGRDLIALLYGITIALILQTLAWFLLYRRSYFIYYITYSLSMLGILAIASFHLQNFMQWFWNLLFLTNAASIFSFMSSALSLRRFTPKIYYAMMVLLAAMTALIAVEITLGRLMPWFVPQIGIYGLSIAAAITRQRQGYKPAAFFVAGWTILTIGFLINAQAYAAHVSVVWRYALYIAFVAESVLFAVAVGFKARLSETQITAENANAFKQMAKVFYPHQLQQIRSGQELELTMPTGAGEACVICFDIVGSSKINHEKAKDFFRAVFRRCNEAMDQDYDPQNLVASGYRVKEMGDGFICSVGYPFKAPTGSMANDALQLSLRFVEIFTEEVASFAYHEPLYCCVGLAMDSILGFYPAGGTKSYDLYGRSIILANRYEAMRKVIFSDHLSASVLILQERVYYSLDRSARDGFVTYKLREHGSVVRDDPAAENLYYLEVNAAEAPVVITMTKSA